MPIAKSIGIQTSLSTAAVHVICHAAIKRKHLQPRQHHLQRVDLQCVKNERDSQTTNTNP
eukprot:386423-Amphidinium_carterae.1